MTELTPQQKLILEYLKEGRALTVKVAISVLNVNSLTKRITELRRLGYDIQTEREQGLADGRWFKKYKLGAKA